MVPRGLRLQALHIQEQAKALDEVRREGQQDIAQAYRLNYAAERRAATMQVSYVEYTI